MLQRRVSRRLAGLAPEPAEVPVATIIPEAEAVPFTIPVPPPVPFDLQTTNTKPRHVDECEASASASAGDHIVSYVRDHTPAGKRRWSICCASCCASDIYCSPGECDSCDRLRAAWIDLYYRGETSSPFLTEYVGD